MAWFVFDYASPSAFESQRDQALLGLSADSRRPVRFHGKVKQSTSMLRFALRALGEVIWSNESWLSEAQSDGILDPIITVHPDKIIFEAFSQDQSTYAQVTLDPALFESEGDVQYGTTNIDFTAWLWAALGEMRSTRETWLRIGAEGVELNTKGSGGRFEQKVDVPDSWVRAFLELQTSMSLPGTRLSAQPVDLLAAIRFFRFNKSRVSPRALRYEMPPGEPARIVLEPWEQVFPLVGSEHNYQELKVTRVWGRKRLRLIEPLLPFANNVDIYLKGRGRPSFYSVQLPGVHFLLGLTGATSKKFTNSSGFQSTVSTESATDDLCDKAYEHLKERQTISIKQLAEFLEEPLPIARSVLARLCRRGQTLYDVEKRLFRHRELFAQPIDEAHYFPIDPKIADARQMVANGQVVIDSISPQEKRKTRRLKTPDGPITREIIYRDWHVSGHCEGMDATEIVLNDFGQIIFGKCCCDDFKQNLMASGPCVHMLALFQASESERKDLPTSREAGPPVAIKNSFNPGGASDDTES